MNRSIFGSSRIRPILNRFERPKSTWFVRGVSVTFDGSSGTLKLPLWTMLALMNAPTTQPLAADVPGQFTYFVVLPTVMSELPSV